MKAILIQTSDATYSEMLDVTSSNTKAFCERRQLEHWVFKGLKRGRRGWHSTFNRLYMFAELIESNHDGWVMYLDADAYIVDMDFPIWEYLRARNHRAGVVVHSGATPAFWDINCGVMFLNLSHPVAKLMVKDWIARHEAILGQPEMLSEQWPIDFGGDQPLIQQMLNENRAWFAELEVESANVMNSMHASFIKHHLRAITPRFSLRLAAIRRETEEVRRKWQALDEIAPNAGRR